MILSLKILMIGILIYEDNDDFRGALGQLIQSVPGYVCLGAFTDCGNVINDIGDFRPDVVLMDIEMRESNGIEGLRQIRKANPALPVIMLTVFDDNKNVLDAICAGASGYVVKKDAFRKLFDAICEVLTGGAPLSMNVARLVLEHISGPHLRTGPAIDLTKREKDILGSLIRGNNNKMTAAELNISLETVKTHIKNIYEKLQVHTQAEAVARAIKDRLI